jgi:hypothetical protein
MKIVPHAHYMLALRRIRELHQQSGQRIPPEHMRILGESGAGKTTLLKDYAAGYPRYDEADRTVVPVLYCEAPSNPTQDRFARAMLLALGSPFWNKGREADKTEQLIALIRACKVAIILLDEMQHLVDRGRRRTHEKVTDWIKQLVDACAVPCVIAGLPRLDVLNEVNDQFGRRFASTVWLHTFEVALRPDQLELMAIFEALLQSEGSASVTVMNEPRFGERLILATNGTVGYLTALTRRAADLSASHSNRIDYGVLATAFEQSIYCGAPPDRNPFSPSFTFSALSRRGEPFAAVNTRPTGGGRHAATHPPAA